METQAPSRGRILTMVIFALSCLGLLLYLWTAFGGSIPLQPRGYRFQVSFNEATQLTQQADVRISGVSVGKVIRTDSPAAQPLPAYDLLLRGGHVIDAKNHIDAVMDVAIKDGHIAKVAKEQHPFAIVLACAPL